MISNVRNSIIRNLKKKGLQNFIKELSYHTSIMINMVGYSSYQIDRFDYNEILTFVTQKKLLMIYLIKLFHSYGINISESIILPKLKINYSDDESSDYQYAIDTLQLLEDCIDFIHLSFISIFGFSYLEYDHEACKITCDDDFSLLPEIKTYYDYHLADYVYYVTDFVELGIIYKPNFIEVLEQLQHDKNLNKLVSCISCSLKSVTYDTLGIWEDRIPNKNYIPLAFFDDQEMNISAKYDLNLEFIFALFCFNVGEIILEGN